MTHSELQEAYKLLTGIAVNFDKVVEDAQKDGADKLAIYKELLWHVPSGVAYSVDGKFYEQVKEIVFEVATLLDIKDQVIVDSKDVDIDGDVDATDAAIVEEFVNVTTVKAKSQKKPKVEPVVEPTDEAPVTTPVVEPTDEIIESDEDNKSTGEVEEK